MAFLPLMSVAFLLFTLHTTEAQIGVCNGMLGDNLPSRQQVVNLYESNNIGLMRIYAPDLATLEALEGTNIKLMLGVPNDQLSNLAQDESNAIRWVETNVVPFSSSIRYIAVGNEVTDSDKPFVHQGMQNVQNALNAANLKGRIKVSTAIFSAFLENTFPPSNAKFNDLPFMGPVVNFLKENESPMLANIYPYFAFIVKEDNIRLDYALFTAPGTVVTDDNNQLQYQNLFDAMVDSVYAALSKAGGHDIPVVVSESGWPSSAGEGATFDNAETYYKNLINHVKKGTPLKPGQLETYLFAMFNENQKPGKPTEQHFGLFFPNEEPKYGNLDFNS